MTSFLNGSYWSVNNGQWPVPKEKQRRLVLYMAHATLLYILLILLALIMNKLLGKNKGIFTFFVFLILIFAVKKDNTLLAVCAFVLPFEIFPMSKRSPLFDMSECWKGGFYTVNFFIPLYIIMRLKRLLRMEWIFWQILLH